MITEIAGHIKINFLSWIYLIFIKNILKILRYDILYPAKISLAVSSCAFYQVDNDCLSNSLVLLYWGFLKGSVFSPTVHNP